MQKSLRLLAAAVAPVPIMAGVMLAAPADASTPAMVAMAQSMNPAVAHSARVADLAAGHAVNFAVALRPRDEAGLTAFLNRVNDPKSKQYHHFLTPAQYTAAYAPTTADVARVTAFLRANGIRVTGVSANRQVVDAAGSASQVGHAFHTTMGVYRQGQRQFFANDKAPTLPPDVAGVVSGVVGLDNHAVRHRLAKPAVADDPADFGFTPSDLSTQYDTASLGTGAGVSVALWEFDGYQQSNVTTYDDAFGLNSPATTTVAVDGANYDAAPGDGQTEVELDIELVQAIAPQARTYSYEAPNTDAGEVDMTTKIVTDDLVSVTSMSWASCEPDSTPAAMTATDAAFRQGVAEGITFFAASGDSGDDGCNDFTTAVDFPPSDPNVSGVGGTTLFVFDEDRGDELAWDCSGGGVSTVFPAPSYQAGSGGMRTVPDVAANADPFTPYAVFSAGEWTSVGGTSASAPVWAGFTALHDALDHGRIGNANPALYAIADGPEYDTAFHDITFGLNRSFEAGPGYDLMTGLGSYDGANLHAALH